MDWFYSFIIHKDRFLTNSVYSIWNLHYLKSQHSVTRLIKWHVRKIRIFIGRTDVEAGTPILWPPDAKNWLIWKDPDAGKYWSREEKGLTEYEMVGWHHWLDGHEFEQTPGFGDGQGGVVCAFHGVAKSWTWLSDWTELKISSTLDWSIMDILHE